MFVADDDGNDVEVCEDCGYDIEDCECDFDEDEDEDEEDDDEESSDSND